MQEENAPIQQMQHTASAVQNKQFEVGCLEPDNGPILQ